MVKKTFLLQEWVLYIQKKRLFKMYILQAVLFLLYFKPYNRRD